ncbi:class I SAM-dependent methyltransferase [Methanolobus sp. WCC4]|uniref:class I SAM-dependent methyltransferase n=1 Tax=Methanolobus sp. WCC4 TaxID=3125784 RepID=UPI0030F99F5C
MKELPEWYYNELVQIGTDYSSEEEVQNYDRKMRTIRNIAEEAETMIKLIDIQPEHSILEIGCGTGEFSIELSKHCEHVLALDISQRMLDFAREKAKTRGRDNIEFGRAGFLTFDPKGKKFDAVVTQLVLHHLPDFWKLTALRNINSMLKDGGRFYLKDVVFSSEVPDFDAYFSQIFENMPPEAGDEIIDEMKLHIKEEFSTFDRGFTQHLN